MRTTKRLRIFLLIIIASASIFFLAGCGQSPVSSAPPSEDGSEGKLGPSGEQLVLKMAASLTAKDILSVKGAMVFADLVEQYSEGRARIDYYPGEQLGKAKDQLNMVEQGLVEICYVAPAHVPSQLPLNTVAMLPSELTKSQDTAAIYWKLVNGVLLDEWKKYGVQPVWIFSSYAYEAVSKRPLRSIDDFKGLKVRTSGGILDQTAALVGATPVAMPGPEIYESFSRGILDATFVSYTSVPAYGLDEVITNATWGANFGVFPGAFVINLKKFSELPVEVQEAIRRAGEEVTRSLSLEVDKEVENLLADFKSKGIEVYQLSSEEKTLWQKSFEPMQEIWLDQMIKQGVTREEAEQVLNEWKRLVDEQKGVTK